MGRFSLLLLFQKSSCIWLYSRIFFCFLNTLQGIWIPVLRLFLAFSCLLFQRLYRTCAKSSLCLLLLNQDSAWSFLPLPQMLFTFSLLFWETPTDVSLIEMGLFIVLLFRSLNKEWLAFNLCAELWECVIRPVCSILGYDAQVEIKQNVWSQIQELSCFYTGI